MNDPRTRAQRCSDAVARFCGSWSFIIVFTVIVLLWIGVNTLWLIFRAVFDPYPFIALNLFLTIISTFQGPLIMMSQNRQAEREHEATLKILEEIHNALYSLPPSVERADVLYGGHLQDHPSLRASSPSDNLKP